MPHPSSDSPTAHTAGVALAGLVGFATLAVLWTHVPTWHRLDAAGLDWIHTQTPEALILWAEAVTALGGLPVTIPLALALAGVLWRCGRRAAALTWGVLFFGGQGVLLSLKLGFSRVRPRAPDLLLHDFSFPSGHAFTAVVLYGALLYVGWTRWDAAWSRSLLALATGALILAIGWSRLVLRVHYPTDVLGGYLLGLAWLALLRIALHHWSAMAPAAPISSSTRSRR